MGVKLRGDRVTVRFIGTTRFAAGVWVGVELTRGTGKNDGSVDGERYFQCEAKHGLFLRPSQLSLARARGGDGVGKQRGNVRTSIDV